MKRSALIAITAATMMATPVFAEGSFNVTSPNIAEGQTIAADQYWDNFGCSGANARPTLNWTGAPEGTNGYAVTFYDHDAPTGSGFWHWVLTDIPASATSIASDAIPDRAIEGNNDAGVAGYSGPCPPVGTVHNYTFTVHALETDELGAPAGASAALTGFFIYQHTLETATLNIVAGPRSE
ncbi:YbhB/YbcL family Raf kinase inhibitor-like protein [Sulfitobacter sp.]|uniref:YbhB/YbcL family Raf kinase inhibitor-like protein n=1 Tax=Sulfitobacter sp. TaxID=1903071 RepID=UPI003002DB45